MPRRHKSNEAQGQTLTEVFLSPPQSTDDLGTPADEGTTERYIKLVGDVAADYIVPSLNSKPHTTDASTQKEPQELEEEKLVQRSKLTKEEFLEAENAVTKTLTEVDYVIDVIMNKELEDVEDIDPTIRWLKTLTEIKNRLLKQLRMGYQNKELDPRKELIPQLVTENERLVLVEVGILDSQQEKKQEPRSASETNVTNKDQQNTSPITKEMLEKQQEEAVKQEFQWLILKANEGDMDAINNIGFCYQTGCGVEKNLSEAIKHYKIAAKKGSTEALNNLGRSYFNGVGVEKNNKLAIEYFILSAKKGNKDAITFLEKLYSDRKNFNKKDQQKKFAAQTNNEPSTVVAPITKKMLKQQRKEEEAKKLLDRESKKTAEIKKAVAEAKVKKEKEEEKERLRLEFNQKQQEKERLRLESERENQEKEEKLKADIKAKQEARRKEKAALDRKKKEEKRAAKQAKKLEDQEQKKIADEAAAKGLEAKEARMIQESESAKTKIQEEYKKLWLLDDPSSLLQTVDKLNAFLSNNFYANRKITQITFKGSALYKEYFQPTKTSEDIDLEIICDLNEKTEKLNKLNDDELFKKMCEEFEINIASNTFKVWRGRERAGEVQNIEIILDTSQTGLSLPLNIIFRDPKYPNPSKQDWIASFDALRMSLKKINGLEEKEGNKNKPKVYFCFDPEGTEFSERISELRKAKVDLNPNNLHRNKIEKYSKLEYITQKQAEDSNKRPSLSPKLSTNQQLANSAQICARP